MIGSLPHCIFLGHCNFNLKFKYTTPQAFSFYYYRVKIKFYLSIYLSKFDVQTSYKASNVIFVANTKFPRETDHTIVPSTEELYCLIGNAENVFQFFINIKLLDWAVSLHIFNLYQGLKGIR